jgi:hypothetical protein
MRWLLTLLLICGGSRSLFAQDLVESTEQVLSSNSFPWYDSATKGAKPLPFDVRPEIRSGDRQTIPPYVPKPKQAQAAGSATSGAVESLDFLFWVFLAIILIAILALLVWTFLRLEAKSQQSIRSSASRSLAESIEQLPFQVEESSGDFRKLAQRAYESGNYRKAIIHLYSHVLVVLDQANLIRLRKGKTNRQYLRELGTHVSLVSYFQLTMESFESVFFGDHEINRQDFEQYWLQLPSFQAEVEQKLALARREVTIDS